MYFRRFALPCRISYQNLQNGAEDGEEDAHLPNGDFLEGFDFGFKLD